MTLISSVVTPGVVPTDMVSLSKSASLIGATPTRTLDQSWVETAFHECEAWSRTLWLRGTDDYRQSTVEVELDAQEHVPLFPTHSNCVGATLVSIDRWSEDAEAYQAYTDRKLLPGGRLMVTDHGSFRIVARYTPDETIPGPIVQAVTRCAAWLDAYGPARVKGDAVNPNPIPLSVAGCVLRSGAASILASYR